MADMILSPIAELIFETLGSAAVQEIKSVYGARSELTKLESTLSTIRAVLVDAEKRQIREDQVRDWLEKLEDVLFDADDLVDEVAAEGERQKLIPGKKKRKKVRTFFSSRNQLVFRHKMARRIKDIRGRLDAISADRERFHFATLTEETQLARRVRDDSHSFVVEENVVGRDKDRRAILELLLDPMEKVSVIPIVGMGGLGKTTLVQLVFNDDRVQKHFDLKIWVCVSNDFKLKVLCEKILKLITNESIPNLEMEQLQQKLREKINEKRYLLVLDDVWNKDGQTWTELKGLLTASCAKGSRVIITTRIHTVAKGLGTMEPYDLGFLDLEKSWNLFKKMADHHKIELTNATLVDIAKGILAKCGGLPLAISMIGSTLCSINPEIDWPSFLENDYLKKTKEKKRVLETLRLSYDCLPSRLKPCFVYCSLFLKDYDFDVQTLITLWIAQGFIQPSQSQSLEETGYGYFRDLLSRSFFQEAKKDKLNKVTACKMHDLVHDLAIQVAGEKYAKLASCEMPIPGKVRHISLSFESDPLEEVPNTWLQAQRIRSFLFPSYVIELRRDSMWDVIIRHYKFLRMLDLHGVGIERVSNSIGKLRHLRYLDLSQNVGIETLPASITKLVNLQTLKLNACYNLRELPSEINKIVNLRHLELKHCREITHMPRGLSQLSNLQTLSTILLSENVPSCTSSKRSKLDELMGLNNLKGDELTIRGIRRGMETTVTKLKHNKHLRSLYLHFRESDDDTWSSEQEWKATIEGLQPHTNLKELSLFCYGGASLYSFLPSLTNLVDLSLDNCSKCQQLPSLDKFHSLKRMSLWNLSSLEYITVDEGDSYFSTSSSPIISVLPSLQTLKLQWLPNFRGWWRSDMVENQIEQVVSPLFPRLSLLIIKNCPKLTSMPCYPNVGGLLNLEKTSWKHFERTMLMRVPQPQISARAMTELEASSSSVASSSISTSDSVSSYPFSQLTNLFLSDVVDLQYLSLEVKSLPSLHLLCIKECPKLKYLSLGIQSLLSLCYLTIDNCKEFEGIKWPETPAPTSLRDLSLSELPKLKYLVPPGIQHLSSLKKLRIEGCEELQVSNDDSIEWEALKSLRTLEFRKLPQLVTLPDRLQFVTALEGLRIWGCGNFTGLPNWICNLCSLDKLVIGSCPNFKSVPRSVSSSTSLRVLSINGKRINPSEIQEDLDLISST